MTYWIGKYLKIRDRGMLSPGSETIINKFREKKMEKLQYLIINLLINECFLIKFQIYQKFPVKDSNFKKIIKSINNRRIIFANFRYNTFEISRVMKDIL